MRSIGLLLALAMASAAASPAAAAGVSRGVMLRGAVSSGAGGDKAAIAGAQVTLYQAGAEGPRPLARATTDQTGGFQVRLRADPDGGVVYAVARKGADVELMTLMDAQVPDRIVINEMTTVASAYAMARLFQDGAIPARPLLPAQVATGMAHNLVSVTNGMPSPVMRASPNADETNAWRLLGTLSNIMAPCVRGSAHACRRLFRLTTSADGGRPETTLQAMVSMARHPAANVRPLFDLGQVMEVYAPNLVAIRQGPDAPDPLMRLDAFTLAIKFNATGRLKAGTGDELCPFGGPANVAFDLNGYAWITNNVVQGDTVSAHCMVVLKPDGSPADGAGATPRSPVTGGGVLGQGFGLGFDPSGTVWAGNFGWGGVDPTDENGDPGGSVSRFTGAGKPLSPSHGYTSNLLKVQGTVSDRQGDIWMASFGNNRLQVFPHGDADTDMAYYQGANTLPFDIRLDSDGSAWVSYNGTSAVSKFTLAEAGPALQFSVPIGAPSAPKPAPVHITGGPKGIAVDSRGDVWVAHGDDNAVYAVDRNGVPLGGFSGGGIDGPWGVSVDSDDTVWVANFGPLGPWKKKPRISQLCGASAGKCPPGMKLGDPISPESGYTLPSGGDEVRLHNGDPLYAPLPVKSYEPLERLTSVNTDMAGNVWCANNWKPSWAIDLASNPGGDGMVVFVGLAAPVMPVLYSAPPQSPFSGLAESPPGG